MNLTIFSHSCLSKPGVWFSLTYKARCKGLPKVKDLKKKKTQILIVLQPSFEQLDGKGYETNK